MFDFKVENLFQNVASVKIIDATKWEAGKCIDGGAYSFTKKYINNGDGLFEVHHHTSADFFFCEACGVFGNPEQHQDCRFETISSLKLMFYVIELSKKYILDVSYSLEYDTIYIYYNKEGKTDFHKLGKIFQNIVKIRETDDVKKVRRKIEDKLRKSSEQDIIHLALEFGL